MEEHAGAGTSTTLNHLTRLNHSDACRCYQCDSQSRGVSPCPPIAPDLSAMAKQF